MAQFSVLSRLKIWQKLAVIAFFLSVPLFGTTIFLVREQNSRIRSSEAQLEGLGYIGQLSKLLVDISRHQSLIRRSNSPTTLVPLKNLRARIDSEFATLQEINSRSVDTLKTSEEELAQKRRSAAFPSTLQTTWDSIKEGRDDQLVGNGHKQLIAGLRMLIEHIGDSSSLFVDRDLDTVYLVSAITRRQPEIMSRLYQVGDAVEDILGNKTISADERAEIASAVGSLQTNSSELKGELERAFVETEAMRNYTKLREVIQDRLQDAYLQAQAVASLASKILYSYSGTYSKDEFAAAITQASDSNESLWTSLLEQQTILLKSRLKAETATRNLAVALISSAIIITLVLTFFVLRSITVPITRAAHIANQLARGELPEKIEVDNSSDEPGMLLRAINSMLQFLDLRNIIITVQQSSGLLTEAVSNLEKSTDEQSQAVGSQATALQQTQVTSQEIKQMSVIAAQKADAVLQYAERAETISRAGEESVRESLGALTQIRTQVEEIAQQIAKLNERTNQISAITDTVKDFADQSNMLALNAAIEAVRSGEHGKGFAVVAREIRSLADQSIQATNRVREILQDISGAIRSAVAITESGAERIESGLIQMNASGEKIKDLASIVSQNSASVRQIAAAVSQQNAGITQIFTAVTDQNRMMEETVKRIDYAKQAALSVRHVSEKVAEVVKRFHV